MFYHQELRLLLVVYVDDFKLAGPKEHLSKGWELINSAVDIGEPEAYDRYFGCHHKEFSQVRLPKSAHPFAHVFDPKLATACQQHRTRDYWRHDPETRTWTRFHLQPRKKLYDPANEGGSSVGTFRVKGLRGSITTLPFMVVHRFKPSVVKKVQQS